MRLLCNICEKFNTDIFKFEIKLNKKSEELKYKTFDSHIDEPFIKERI